MVVGPRLRFERVPHVGRPVDDPTTGAVRVRAVEIREEFDDLRLWIQPLRAKVFYPPGAIPNWRILESESDATALPCLVQRSDGASRTTFEP